MMAEGQAAIISDAAEPRRRIRRMAKRGSERQGKFGAINKWAGTLRTDLCRSAL
jgi:hypothetical protein